MNATNRVVAVTGATGFIGRRLVSSLRAGGVRVRALVRDTARAPVDVDAAGWDLKRGGDPAVLAGADVLVHAAAYVPTSMADASAAEKCWHVNALGTHRLLEAAVSVGVKHVIHVSTGNAYRQQPRDVAEDDPLYPSHRAPYYLTSKLCGEVFADHFARTGRADVAILRPSAVFGPGMPSAGLVPMFVARMRNGERVTVQDGGRYQADLVFVDDVVAAIVAAVERRASGAFNVGSGRATTSLELARELAALTGRDASVIDVVGNRDGPAVSGFSALDVTRARRELGYEPRTLRAGLLAYLESL